MSEYEEILLLKLSPCLKFYGYFSQKRPKGAQNRLFLDQTGNAWVGQKILISPSIMEY